MWGEDTYEKVTSTSQLVAGNDYLLVNAAGEKSLGTWNSGSSNKDYYALTNVTANDDKSQITNAGSAHVLQLGGESGAWTFYDKTDSKYLSCNASANGVQQSTTATADAQKWTISIANGVATITNNSQTSRKLQYNASATRWACYTGSQADGVLYVKSAPAANVNITGITLSQASATLTMESEPLQLTATVNPSNATNKTVTWSSDDESVATVSSTGLVTPIATGTATITATATNGTVDDTDDQTATCTITVSSISYAIALADGTDDASNWTIPSSATAGSTINVAYPGERVIETLEMAPTLIEAYYSWTTSTGSTIVFPRRYITYNTTGDPGIRSGATNKFTANSDYKIYKINITSSNSSTKNNLVNSITGTGWTTSSSTGATWTSESGATEVTLSSSRDFNPTLASGEGVVMTVWYKKDVAAATLTGTNSWSFTMPAYDVELQVEYEPAALSSIAITTAPTKTTYNEGETFDPTGMVVTATYSNAPSADVTASCSFSPSTSTALTTNNTVITVSYTENAVERTTSQAITVNALPKYTVTFSDGGSETQASYGAAVTLPSRSVIDDYGFAGWSENNVSEETTTAPTTIIPAGSYTPTADITLYPVYTKTVGGGTEDKTASVNIETYATNHSWTSGTKYESVTLDANVIATGTQNGDNSKYYSNGNDWRFYASTSPKGTVTISTTAGTLSSVTLTFSGTFTYGGNNITSGTAVNVSGTSAEFTCTANAKITAISVTYSTSSSTTYYWSAPEAPAVDRPEITVAANPFLFSTTATITCDTEDATIKYSFDNETWNNYSSALTITSTTTLYAKAVKDANESTVASVAITKNLAEPTVTVSGDLTVDLNGETDVEAGTLTAAVTYNESAVDGATVTWSSSDTDIATINPSTGAVVIKTRGTVTFTATYAGNSDYAEATGTKEITVTDSKAPGTETRPYTVAEAIDATPASGTSANVYIQGYVSAFHNTSIVGDGSNYRYYISDDGTTTSQLLVYRGKKNSTDNFSDASDLEIGDKVTIYGGLTTYNSTKEVASGNYIVTRVEKPASDLAKTSDITLDVKNNALTANISDHISSSSAGTYTYESADPTVATVSAGGVVTGLKVGTTTITVNQAASLSYKAGSVEIPVTVADTREDATTIPAINITTLTEGDANGTISVVDPVKADEGVTFSFASSDNDVLSIIGNAYTVGEVGTATVTVTATPSNTNLYKAVVANFDVTVQAAVMSENEIMLDEESGSTIYGTPLNVDYVVADGYDGTMSYTIANSAIADVTIGASAITFTPKAVGSTTVTISAPATGHFLAADDVIYTLTVTAPTGSATAPASGFFKVTATEDITDGEYLIVYEDGGVAFDGGLGTLDAESNTIDVEITDDVIPATNETKAATFTIDATAGTIQSISGYYIGQTSNANGMVTSDATAYTNTMSIENNEDVVILSSGGAYLRYNSTSGQTRFRYFKSSTYTSQNAIQLYKLTDASETVTLNKYGFATYCSVNPMDFSSTEGYTAWRVSNVSGDGTITFEKITEAIKGGQGVLLYNKDADGESTSNVTVTFANGTTEFNSSQNKLFGTTAPTYVGANEYFGLSADHFVKVNAGTVKAGKALLPYFDKVSGIKTFTFIFNDSATGITESRTVSREVVETIFDLNGRRLSKPQRGINIVNGRKVVVK